MTFGDKQL